MNPVRNPLTSNGMKRVIVVHRWSGGPGNDWRPWLRKELEQSGYVVIMPAMPDTDVPVIKKWVDHLAEVVGTPDSDTYFIGHSIGCQAVLRYLETINVSVGGAVFVAGWFNLKNLEDAETEELAKPWVVKTVNIQKVKTVLPKSTLVISDNDPYDCFEENEKKFIKLGSEIVVVPHAGHFTSDDGFETFPQLLEVVQKIIT